MTPVSGLSAQGGSLLSRRGAPARYEVASAHGKGDLLREAQEPGWWPGSAYRHLIGPHWETTCKHLAGKSRARMRASSPAQPRASLWDTPKVATPG